MFNGLSGEEQLPHLSLRPFLQASEAQTLVRVPLPLGSPAQAGKSNLSPQAAAHTDPECDYPPFQPA